MTDRKIRLILDSLNAAADAALAERPLPEDLAKPQFRRMRSDVAKDGYSAENHTVTLTISSEFPVERWDGTEILVHDRSAIDTSRLDEGISHLYNHNWDTLLGRTVSYEIANKKLSVTSKYGTNTDAKQREQDLADGILPDVSLGYQILKVEVTEDKNGNRTYNVVRWMPYEWSSVTVPADYTVGLNRSAMQLADVEVHFRKLGDGDALSPPETATEPTEQTRSKADVGDPDEDDDEDPDEDERNQRSVTPDTTSTTQPTEQRTQTMATAAVTADPQQENKERIAGLRSLMTTHPQHFTAERFADAVANGTSVRDAKDSIFDAVVKAAETSNVRSAAEHVIGSMGEREQRQYSRVGAVRAAINLLRPGTFDDGEAGLAREVSDSIRKEAGARGITGLGNGIMTPGHNNMRFAQMNAQQRAISSGGSVGAATNVTNVIVPPIELLRPRTICLPLGARMMPGLHGTPSFTRQNAAASSNWLSEGSLATNSDAGVEAFQMVPHRLSIANSYYRDFLALSALSVDDFMAQDRDAVLALSLDYAIFAGSGVAPVPLGLLNRTGLGTTLSGSTRSNAGVFTAGLGGVPPTYVDLNAMEAAISTANADISTLGWATTPKVRAAMRSVPKIPGASNGDVLMPDSKVGSNGIQEGPLGYNMKASTNMPTNFTVNSVANLHPLVLGCFDQILIGDWDLNEIIADNITGAAQALYKIFEHGYYDTTVRHLESFNVMFVLPS